MTKRARRSKRKAQARWRKNHPVMAAWHTHKWNAKLRGIPLLWDFDEFARWCVLTGYHILREDGFQIHREGDVGAYCSARCSCIPQRENLREEWINRKMVAKNQPVAV